jgi:hypothetical protein
MQTTQSGVDVAQAGGEAGDVPGLVKGAFSAVDRRDQGDFK